MTLLPEIDGHTSDQEPEAKKPLNKKLVAVSIGWYHTGFLP
jgi:hypothetical protein